MSVKGCGAMLIQNGSSDQNFKIALFLLIWIKIVMIINPKKSGKNPTSQNSNPKKSGKT